jgi:Recombinational DNA repair protein (RecF pathway)
LAYYPEPVARLIEALQRLPGIGPKTAQRLTFFLLKRPLDEVQTLAESLTQLKQLIVHCHVCFNVTEEDPCRICSDPRRDQRALCIVEEPNDLLALERTGEFRGATMCSWARSLRSTASAPRICASASSWRVSRRPAWKR